MPDEADELITTRIKIEVEDSISDAIRFRKEVDVTKEELRALAESAKASYDEIGRAAKENLDLSGLINPEDTKRRIDTITAAVKELNQEEASIFKAVQQLSKNNADLQIQEQKRIQEAEKETQQARREEAKSTEANLKQQAKVLAQLEQETQQQRRTSVKEAEAEIRQQILARNEAEKQVAEEEKQLQQGRRNLVRETENEIRQQLLIRQQIEKQQAEEEKQRLQGRRNLVKETENEIRQQILVRNEAEKQAAEEEKQRLQARRNLVRETENEIQQQILIRQQIEKQQAEEEKQLQQGRREAAKEREAENKQQALALQELDKQTQANTKSFRLFGIEINNVGDIARAVFVGLFGFTVIGIIRSTIRYLGDAVEEGKNFTASLFELSVAVRALQRSGIDTTFKEVTDNIQRLKDEFPIFSYQELNAGTASLIQLTRNLGLSQEQISNLQEESIKLALINNRSIEEVQTTIARFLSSGYTEGIQRLGININRANLAQEALKQGFEDNYLALEESNKALIGYGLLLEKNASLGDDFTKFQDTAAGQSERLSTALEDVKTGLGAVINQQFGGFVAILSEVLEGFASFLIHLKDARTPIRELSAAFVELAAQLDYLRKVLKDKDLSFDLEELRRVGREARDAFLNPILDDLPVVDQTTSKIEKAVEKILNNVLSLEKDFAKQQADIAKDAQRDLEQIEREGARKREDIAIDYGQKIAEIFRDTNDRIVEQQIDYNAKLEELARNLVRAIEEAAIDLQQRLEDARRSLQQKLADAEREYRSKQAEAAAAARQKEIDAEKAYQEKLLKLREQFLFDLEEALHERDARQVLRLIRQFNLRSGQLAREAANEKEERTRQAQEREEELKNEHEERIAEIRREYERELEELRIKHEREIEEIKRKNEAAKQEAEIDFNSRLEDIKRRRDIEIREATIGYQQELADLQRSLAAQRQERLLRLAQQNQDIVDAYNKKLQLIAQGLASELKLTGDGMLAVYTVLYRYLGPGGATDQLFQYYVASAQAAAQAAANALGSLKSTENTKTKAGSSSSTSELPDSVGFAQGGAAFANRPTSVTFGEVPEIATFTPLSMFKSPQPPGSVSSSPGSSGLGNGKLGIEIMLDNGLVARIIDTSLGEFATIIEKNVSNR